MNFERTTAERDVRLVSGQNPLANRITLIWFGGGERDRTDDPLLAKQVLSQLSYTPISPWWVWVDLNHRPHAYQACALTN